MRVCKSLFICALVCRTSEVVLHPRDILGLCVYLYSLAGPNASVPDQCENQLQVYLDIGIYVGHVN